MATLQKIRNQGTLLTVIIFVALATFVLGDAFKSGAFGDDSQLVGEIDGNEIHILDFQKEVNHIAEVQKMTSGTTQLDEQAMVQVRNQVWNEYEFEYIYMPAFENLGIDVTADELFDMVQGNHIHPAIQSMFTDPQTGQFNRSAVLNFLRAVNDGQVNQQQYVYWNYLEDQIKKERLANKYNALVGKGIYFTSLEAKNSFDNKNTNVDFDYVGIPYTTVSDSLFEANESELQEYYDAHKEEFKQEPTRAVQYVILPIKPTQDDEDYALSWINDIRDEFATASDNEQFVNANSDEGFASQYVKRSDLPEDLEEFAYNSNIGAVYGPQREGMSYKLYKLDDRSMLPDSVRARHILINPEEVGGIEAANHLADSLRTLIVTNKASFAVLASKYSVDTGSSAQGGDLGWFGRNQMIKTFEDAAFNSDVNDVEVVTSQFGVHIIQTTQKGHRVQQVRLAELVRNIEPSTQTEDAVYANASMLATKSTPDEYVAAYKDLGLNVKTVSLTKTQQDVPGFDDSRSFVRAAFQTEGTGTFINSNEDSPIFKFDDNFVLAQVTEINDDEYASLASRKLTIGRQVIQQKKAAKIAEDIKAAGSDITSIATAMDVTPGVATGVNFDMYMIPTLGIEPAVQGTATSLAQGAISEPVAGMSGVFVTNNKVVREASVPTEQDLVAEQVRLSTSTSYRVNQQSFLVLRESVDYTDNRANFY